MIRWITIFLLWISLCIPIGMDTPYFVYAADTTTSTSSDDSDDNEPKYEDPYADLDKKVCVPPFPGGPITGLWGELRTGQDGRTHKHAGIDVGFDDVAIRAPVDGYVWHKDARDDRYGWGVAYFESMANENELGLDIRLLFADLDEATAGMSDGPVKKGDIIGYVRGFINPPSTGAHVHVNEYLYSPASPKAPYLDFEGTRDPTALLTLMGCDFSGTDYSGPNAGKIGSDKPEVSFNIEILKTLGDELNQIIKDWCQHAIDAVKNITPFALGILGVLCVIDLTLGICLAGMSFNFNDLVIKIIRYAAIFGLIYAWPKFINDILLSFVNTLGGVLNPDPSVEITSNMTQPQLLLQKAIYVIAPAFEKIGTFTTREWLSNFGSILAIYILTFIVLLFYGAAAIHITVMYIEFYISAGLSLVSVPMASWKFIKFVPEGMGGHLISSAIRLLLVSLLVGMGALAMKDARPEDIFKVPIMPAADGPFIGEDDPNVGAGLASTNPMVPIIIQAAREAQIDPCLALAIAARESGGDNVDDITMHPYPDNGDGMFQVESDNDGIDPITGDVVLIDEYFAEHYPDKSYKTDPELNAKAAMMVLKIKINRDGGNIWSGVRDYNGSPRKEWYMNRVKRNFELISGRSASTVGHTAIAAPMLIKYLKVCLGLITIALLILILPGRIIRVFQGPVPLP